MTRPEVSVAIITYNHRRFIAEAIESVLAQETRFPVRIHIGDDHSTDGTREILYHYQERFPERIVLNLQPEHPPGIPGRVNNITNLQSCDGDYIALLDGDDYWTDPRKLQTQVDFLEAHPGHAGSAHDATIVGSAASTCTVAELSPQGRPDAAIDLGTEDILDRRLYQTSTFLFRRKALTLPPWFSKVYSADYALFLLASQHGPIRFDPAARSAYRVHGTSVMAGSGDARWARQFVVDAPIFFDAFPGSATFRQRMIFLRAQRIAAATDGRWIAAFICGARLLASDPRALLRLVRERLGRG
jgi:glycosyltransferase involved in cell wall biosynthesis